jgi:hypothetical protein
VLRRANLYQRRSNDHDVREKKRSTDVPHDPKGREKRSATVLPTSWRPEMTMRSSRSTLTFSNPSTLAGYPGELPAGDDDILVEDERLQGLTFEA